MRLTVSTRIQEGNPLLFVPMGCDVPRRATFIVYINGWWVDRCSLRLSIGQSPDSSVREAATILKRAGFSPPFLAASASSWTWAAGGRTLASLQRIVIGRSQSLIRDSEDYFGMGALSGSPEMDLAGAAALVNAAFAASPNSPLQLPLKRDRSRSKREYNGGNVNVCCWENDTRAFLS